MARKRRLLPNQPTDLPTPRGGRIRFLPQGYGAFLKDLKDRIRSAQVKAGLAANRELVLLYWTIGRDIVAQQQQYGRGAKVIDRLAVDLHRALPEAQGFSARNLKYMRSFAQAWPNEVIVQEALARITWYHTIALLEKLPIPEQRLWYARQTVQHGWSRNVLVHQIDSCLHLRQGQALTNFDRTLPAPQSDLAQQVLKDSYNFDFLTLTQDAHERELEQGLLEHLRDFLLELGVGFAFVGSQYHLEVDGTDFYLDLLFYHSRLRAYLVIDLKMGEFQPNDHAGASAATAPD